MLYTEIIAIVFIIGIWTLLGGTGCATWAQNKNVEGWELCNPYWAHHYYTSVNWFGAIMISLVYTILCPLGAVCYWFYKLCTVGR